MVELDHEPTVFSREWIQVVVTKSVFLRTQEARVALHVSPVSAYETDCGY